MNNKKEIILEMIKGKDGLGQADLIIDIDGIQAYLPLEIILDFLNDNKQKAIKVKIPN